MSGKIEIYPDAEGGWRFRVKAGNNEIVGVGESYSSKQGAERGVEALKRALGLYDEVQWGYSVDMTGKGAVCHATGEEGSADHMIEMFKRMDAMEIADVDWKLDPKLVKRNILVSEWEVVDE